MFRSNLFVKFYFQIEKELFSFVLTQHRLAVSLYVNPLWTLFVDLICYFVYAYSTGMQRKRHVPVQFISLYPPTLCVRWRARLYFWRGWGRGSLCKWDNFISAFDKSMNRWISLFMSTLLRIGLYTNSYTLTYKIMIFVNRKFDFILLLIRIANRLEFQQIRIGLSLYMIERINQWNNACSHPIL